jgi:hypothetical protein
MTLEQRAELVWRHADDGQDVPQGAPGHVATRMDGDWNPASIRMLHEVVATGDSRDGEPRAFERLYDLRSRYDWDASRHKPGRYYNSGDVECQSEFLRYPDLFDQQLKPSPQIRDRLFQRRTIANSAHTRTEQGRGAPDAVLVLLDGVRHVNDTSHNIEYCTDAQQNTAGNPPDTCGNLV